jgi:glycosyltransferase involved in cell wall biosynthesis
VNIVTVCGSWPPIKCGIGDCGQRLAQELAGQGYSVVAITGDRAGAAADSGVTVWPLMESWGPATLPALLRAVRRADPAVVHLHYPTEEYGRFSAIDWLPLAVRALLRRPVVATIHEYGTFRRLGRRRVEMLARTSTAVIVPDRQNLEALAAAMPSLRPRLHHVPLGPALEPDLPPDYDRRQWRAGRGIGAETLVLTYFGFITPSKGVELLLAALDQLPAELDLHLWLLAGHEPSHPRYAGYHAAVAGRLQRLEQPHRLTWTGYLAASSVSAYLAAADLAVLPYRDGASLRRTTMLAALAHGLPVLSTGDEAPAPGVAVTATRAEALAEAIAGFYHDRARLEALAGQARQAAAQISWPAIARATAAVLEQAT